MVASSESKLIDASPQEFLFIAVEVPGTLGKKNENLVLPKKGFLGFLQVLSFSLKLLGSPYTNAYVITTITTLQPQGTQVEISLPIASDISHTQQNPFIWHTVTSLCFV